MEINKVIDTLQDMVAEADGDQFIALRTAIDAVIQVRALIESDKWIRVEDGLPEMHEVKTRTLPWIPEGMEESYWISDPVLVTGKRMPKMEDDPPVLIGCYEDDGGGRTCWQDLDCEDLHDVTAWQPLPLPYSGKVVK